MQEFPGIFLKNFYGNALPERTLKASLNLKGLTIRKDPLSFRSALICCKERNVRPTRMLVTGIFAEEAEKPFSVTSRNPQTKIGDVRSSLFVGVCINRTSENMQEIYWRRAMPKCLFNKVASNFTEITFWLGCSTVNLLHIFKTPFPKNTSGGLLLSCFQNRYFLRNAQQKTYCGALFSTVASLYFG